MYLYTLRTTNKIRVSLIHTHILTLFKQEIALNLSDTQIYFTDLLLLIICTRDNYE